MWQYVIKIIVTAVFVVLISEASKRWTLLGAVIASVPLTSVLAMVWLYVDTNDIAKVNALSINIFWVVIPSLLFFVLFPTLTKMGQSFWPALSVSICSTAIAYWGYIYFLKKVGVEV